ncbi:unnamed protein product [Urochloa humidicola]
MAAGISPALLWRSIYILFLITSLAATATSFSFFYNFSNPATFSHGDLSFEGDAYIGSGSIILAKEQLTGNTTSRSGRVSYAYPVSLRSNDTGEVLGFSANFSFVINGSQSPIDTGGGLAFFLTPYPSRMPPNSEGGYLGIFNSTTVAGGDDWIVAVEMDSNRDHGWDDATMSPHIAVDVNKLHSGKNSYKAVDELVDGVPYVFQVDYSDVTKDLVVVLRDSTAGVPLIALKKSVDLSMFMPREVAMGISAATGSSNMATHHVLWWSYDTSTNRTTNLPSLIPAPDARGNFVVPDSPPPADTELASPPFAGAGRCNRPVLVAIVVFAVLAIVTAAVVALLCLLSRSSYGSCNSLGLSDKIPLLPIYEIMLDFELIGQSCWRTVTFYYAIISTSIICHMRRMRYQNRLQIGWCTMRTRILLVYDHILNGRLSDHLNGRHSPGRLLTWPMRYKIAFDVGSALEYLHSQSRPILHGNIRTDNVMLDELFNASLGGFHESCTEENDLESQKASRSDVFSFGTFLLEVMCGRQIHGETAASLVERVWSLHDQGEVLDAADERLEGQFDREQAERVLLVGLWCAHPDHWQRPSIAEAMRSLRSEAPLPSLPPRTPEIFIDIERA